MTFCAALLAGAWSVSALGQARSDRDSGRDLDIRGDVRVDTTRPIDDRRDDRRDDRMRDDRERPRGGYADRFDDLSSGRNSASDFPIHALNAAVDANARAAAARAQFNRIDFALGAAIREAKTSFESSADYRNAIEDERRAYAELKAARDAVVRKLQDEPRYRSAIELRDEFTQRITERRSMRGVPMGEVFAMALVKLGYATTATALEAVAEADDARVRDAQSRLVSAGMRVADLRRTWDDRLRTDDRMAGLRRQLEEARTNRVIAAAVAEGAIEVGNQALDYAYWRHQYDYRSNNYANDYGPYGYPYYPVRFR